ncbi:MAG: 2-succinyl-5-enolpyruvyl-6-hydroxy-3-cyclohexene-1-carboxylate synthase [Myxococcota bacterium]|jgi:2-succinyl-5-enolpyruvyl-6-hydroxy-3-cyclohexene-1-carboxylate synthase
MIGEGDASLSSQNSRWGALIIEELSRLGVPLFCMSPGSRSTPLTAALAARPSLRQRVITDERGAAFCALGASKATGRPAVLITTSGTAMANAYPAVIEADRTGIPLLLLSADRPSELRESGANQTIDQVKLFGDRVRWFADLPSPDTGFPAPAALTTLDEAHHRTLCAPAGPVHLNLPFREPLGPVDIGLLPDDPRLDRWRNSSAPWTRSPPPHLTLPPAAFAEAATLMAGARRGLLVVGATGPHEPLAAIEALAAALGWPVYADVSAGLALRRNKNTLPLFDYLLADDHFQTLAAPDVIVHIGGPVVSKRYLRWLSDRPPQEHIVLRADPRRHDPSHSVTLRLSGALSTDLAAAITRPRLDTDWRASLLEAHSRAAAAVDARLSSTPELCEPHIARIVSEESKALLIGNSMPIRDVDLFGRSTPERVAVSRGASGIDGLIATAAGWADGHRLPTVALIGDLSALHDLSSLALLARQEVPLKLVIVNNGGGGIFSFLPVSGFAEGFESHFATAHPFRFSLLAAAFGLAYRAPEDAAGLRAALREEAEGAMIIEVQTRRDDNIALHRALLQDVVAASRRNG